MQKITSMSRRTFLEGVAALTASAAVLSVLPNIADSKISPDVDLHGVTSPEKARRIARAGAIIIRADTQGGDSDNEYLCLSMATGGEVDRLFIDGQEVAMNGNGEAMSGDYFGLVTMKKAPWKHAKYKGVDLRLKYDAIKFPDGIPLISFG